jgi:cytidylate kinase
MIVTIDGPAGAGKSTVARSLARRLEFEFLDTGAMYRAVAYAGLTRGIDLANAEALTALAGELQIDFRGGRLLLDGADVSETIRTRSVTSATHFAADNPGVRHVLVDLQREAALGKNIVTEGRDQGTVVFPDAECKIFLSASAEERARRRMADLARRGENVSFDEVLADQNLRDQRDAQRAVGPLIPAVDAIHVLTDGLSPDEVAAKIEGLARSRMVT